MNKKVKIINPKSRNKEQVLKNLKKGLAEVRLFKQGKLESTSAKDFLNKL